MTERFRPPILLVAVFILGIAMSTSCGGTSGGDAKIERAASSSPATVATFQGDGRVPQDTAPFTLRGGKVRFRYTVEHNDSGPVPFLWQMFKQGAPVSPNELARDSCASCDGPQSNDLGTVPAGSYYVHVITSRPWTLTIEENR